MGLFGLIKKQFIDVIQWNEDQDGVLAFRYPTQDQEIQNGAQLTVRESQVALFVNEGTVADVFEPGLHALTTQNMPVMTTLRNWDKAFKSPFKSDVYFFSTRDQLDQRWGTPNAITIRDKELGPLRIRAHGTYSYKIKNPKVFYKKVSGTREAYTTEDMDGQLRSIIVTSLSDFFGKAPVGFIDMAGNQTEFSKTLKTALDIPFDQYGLELVSFYVQSVSLPEELQAHLDKVAEMNMVGDIRKYAQFQAADSIAAAAASGGIAGAGAGMGVGMALGQTMNAALGGNMGGNSGAADPAADPVAMLAKLHELLTKGILTQAEFDTKKAEILKKIT